MSGGGASDPIMSILGALVATPPWETGIVILPAVRETDLLCAIYSQNPIQPVSLVRSPDCYHTPLSFYPWMAQWGVARELGGEVTQSWKISTSLAFLTSKSFGPFWLNLWHLQAFPPVLFWGAVFCLKNQSCTSNCSDTFFIPKHSHAPLFLSTTHSHILTLMFYPLPVYGLIGEKDCVHLHLCRTARAVPHRQMRINENKKRFKNNEK